MVMLAQKPSMTVKKIFYLLLKFVEAVQSIDNLIKKKIHFCLQNEPTNNLITGKKILSEEKISYSQILPLSTTFKNKNKI
ncbi:hypothetical protein BpHYR1_030784 [Brachionus plicatilis]|uniref:Uncharacterized protein n=1 Tax=Brachionus plicatilis TaxID=10195 RepID=A0A3M7RIZ3_BRAPC|nr:hypothetical protein BpHYR1_030784 [Brachionus plicatilis]